MKRGCVKIIQEYRKLEKKQRRLFFGVVGLILVFCMCLLSLNLNVTGKAILSSNAEHLNENRNFISNIYDKIKDLDGSWSEIIENNHYVRITFEKALDNTNDITLYSRIVDGNPRIEVYEVDRTEKIAEFTSLNSNEYNKIYLTNLKGSQDTFDLRVTGGSIELDYITDPENIWIMNETINASLPILMDEYEVPVLSSTPSVFYKDSSWYLISGGSDGNFYGFAYNGTDWLSNSTIISGLSDIGDNSAPSIFYKDSSWYMIAGNKTGPFSGYVWNGTQWLENSTIITGLPPKCTSNCYPTPSVFYKDSSWYLIAGNLTGLFNGYAWNGTNWLVNTTINASLSKVDLYSAPSVFNMSSTWYLISGADDGKFYGFVWNSSGTQWLSNSTIITGLPDIGSSSRPSVFYKDSSWYMIAGVFDPYGATFYGFAWAPDTIPPTYSLNTNNNSYAGYITRFSINVTDNSALNPNGMYVFSTNNTGVWLNNSAVNFTATPSRVNATKILTSTVGTLVGYRWYFNDTVGNTNSTPIYTLRTTSYPSTIPFEFKMSFVRNSELNNSLSLPDSTKLVISAKSGQVITVNNLPDYDQFDKPGWAAMLVDADKNSVTTDPDTTGDYLYYNFTTINRTAKNLTFAAGASLTAWEVTDTLILYNPFLNYEFVDNQSTIKTKSIISTVGAPAWRAGAGTVATGGGPMFRHSDGRFIWMFHGRNATVFDQIGFAYSTNMVDWTIGNNDFPIFNQSSIPNTIRVVPSGQVYQLDDGRYYVLLSCQNFTASNYTIRILYFDENFTTFTYSEPIIADKGLGYQYGSILKIGEYYHLVTMFFAPTIDNRTIVAAKSLNLEGPYTIYQEIVKAFGSVDGTIWDYALGVGAIHQVGTEIFGTFTGSGSQWVQGGTRGNSEIGLLDFNQTTEVWSVSEKSPIIINPFYYQNLDGTYLWIGDHLGGELGLLVEGNNIYMSISGKGTRYQAALLRLKNNIPPTYNSASHNSTAANQIVKFVINVTDDAALHPNGRYIFSTNNTGSWINDSVVNFTETSSWTNVTKTLNSIVGTIVGYMWYFLDNESNANSTTIYILTTTELDTTLPTDSNAQVSGGSILRLTSEQIQKGYENIFREKQKIRLNLSNQKQYLIEIKEINKSKGGVIVFVDENNYSVEVNNSVKINLDNEEYYNLKISLIQIYSTGYAKIGFKEIHEEIPSEEQEQQQLPSKSESEEEIKIKNWMWISGGAIVLIVIGIVVGRILKKKDKFLA